MAFDGLTLEYADYVQSTAISTPGLSQGTLLNNYIIDGAPFDGDPANANGRFDVVIRYSCGAAYAPYLTQQFDFSYHQENSRKKIDLTHLMVHFGGRSAAVNRSEFFLRKLCAGHGGINSCAPFLENFAMPSSTSPMETIRATGSVADDRIFGLGGNEILAGADLLDGGTGTDTATYAASLAGVNVNLMTGAAGGRHETCWILRS